MLREITSLKATEEPMLIPSWGSKSHPAPEHTPGVRYPGSSGTGCELLPHEGIRLSRQAMMVVTMMAITGIELRSSTLRSRIRK